MFCFTTAGGRQWEGLARFVGDLGQGRTREMCSRSSAASHAAYSTLFRHRRAFVDAPFVLSGYLSAIVVRGERQVHAGDVIIAAFK